MSVLEMEPGSSAVGQYSESLSRSRKWGTGHRQLSMTSLLRTPESVHLSPGLTSGGAIALMADLPQAVEALVDTAQSVLQLTVLAGQGVSLDVGHVRRTDEVLITLCRARHRMS